MNAAIAPEFRALLTQGRGCARQYDAFKGDGAQNEGPGLIGAADGGEGVLHR
ncbi:MAG: hypothetical protein L0210_00710 [Rhodospirillales bacterium]|nr:hypothetical protein [Rhodospirillales bacterium]